jgi:CMP-N,N'-diacetyllegionaminic acid synthase
MSILITICARGGSKGIPGKNIKLLNGVHLIGYTIQVANRFAELFDADIVLSTDNDEIKRIAALYSLSCDYVRPDYLASDTAGKIDTIKDVLIYQENMNNLKYEYVLDLDVTSPLRTLEDLVNAFNFILHDQRAHNLFSVNPAARNPYFNMVEQKENGYYQLIAKSGNVMTRQSAPKVYDLNASFYFFKRAFFSADYKTVFTDASLIYTMPHICFDLDHVIDFDFLEFLLVNQKLDFQIWKS